MSDPVSGLSTESGTSSKKARPEFRNINAFTDLTTYRMPAAAIVSILHRASGAIIFLLLPFIIWMFDKSISSEFSYIKFMALFHFGIGFVPGWFFKLVALVLIWGYLHHLTAGLRHLWLDVSHKAVTKSFGKASAIATFAISLPLTVALGAKLFGLY